MSTFDIVLLILLGLGAFKGYTRGFIVEFFSFIAFFIGLFLALELTIPVATELFGSSNYLELAAVIVFIALFVLLSMLIKLGAKALKSIIDMTLFGTLDNVAGAIAGMLKWAFVISILFWVFESVGFDLEDQYAANAVIFPYIVDIGPKVFEWLGQVIPMIQDLIDSLEDLPNGKGGLMTYTH